MKKNLIISYRENDEHAKLIPIITSTIQKFRSDIQLSITKYPREELKESIKNAVSELFPRLESGSVYMSDMTSSPSRKLEEAHESITTKYLSTFYKGLFPENSASIKDYDECGGKSIDELQVFVESDFESLTDEIAKNIHTLDQINEIQFVISSLSDHISSLRNLIDAQQRLEGVQYEHIKDEDTGKSISSWEKFPERREKAIKISNDLENEWGEKYFDLLKKKILNKEVILNKKIDKSRSSLSSERREYLHALDHDNICIINDGHNWLGNPNNRTDFGFKNALVLAPNSGYIGSRIDQENKRNRIHKISGVLELPEEEVEKLILNQLNEII